MTQHNERVTAHAPNSPGPFSSLANQVQNVTGAACVALVIVMPDGSGAYAVSGTLEEQTAMPDLLAQVARELQTQIGKSVQ